MLTFPQVLTHEGVVVFPDDEDPNLFYLLPGRPHLRVEGGKPVFRGLFWTDAADGAAGSVAGLRGALLNFDVNLEVTAGQQEELGRQIRDTGVQQARHDELLRAERERLDRQARAMGENPSNDQPRVPDVAAVRFGAVQFLGGNVVLLEEKSGGFVEWSSAGGPPSLIADNNSAFALRLGAEGAAVWYRALQQDATAIGVRYELKLQARLPSLEIHVWAGSHQKLDLDRIVERVVQNEDQGCSDADVEHIDVKSVTSHLVDSSLINIEIIKGTAKISDEDVSQLRTVALGLIQDKVKEVIANRIHGMTEEERKTSLIGHIEEEITAFAELRLNQRDTVEWNVNPQATITDFLGGLTGTDRAKLVTLVDLSDPVVSTLELAVSVDAPWTGNPQITKVDVMLDYPPAGESRLQSVELANGKDQAVVRWRRAKGDRGTVRYSARAFVLGAAEPIPLPGGETNGVLHLQVPLLGAFSAKLRPHPNLFGQRGAGKITGVEIDYRYKDEGAPDHVAGSVVLRPEDADGVVVEHTTFRRIDAPLKFLPTYLRDGNPDIVGAEQQVWITTGQQARVEIPSPWRDFLRVGARVPPGLAGLTRAKVDLLYKDAANGFESDATIALDHDGDWQGSTTVVQLDKTQQKFSYRYTVEGESQLAVGPWVDAEGDQDLVLPVLAVRVRLDRLQLGQTFTDANIRLTYEEPGRTPKYELVQEIFVSAGMPDPIWLVPRVDPNLDSYRYAVTLFPKTGPQVDLPEAQGRGQNLILRPPA
ncbi:MAG TPA: hypothetical protein VGM86_04930 [Thermoanaerobaculia bacterium]|jgi:hypothetical protein